MMILRYILKDYGHAPRVIDAKEAVTWLQEDGVPHVYAVNLLSLAETRCRLQYNADLMGGNARPFIRTVISSTLSVEYGENGAGVVQTPAAQVEDSGRYQIKDQMQLASGEKPNE